MVKLIINDQADNIKKQEKKLNPLELFYKKKKKVKLIWCLDNCSESFLPSLSISDLQASLISLT